jgi:hypothetical protein
MGAFPIHRQDLLSEINASATRLSLSPGTRTCVLRFFTHTGVAFPTAPSLEQWAFPAPKAGTGVPRLLVVWLYQQYFLFLLFIKLAILMPKGFNWSNGLILIRFLNLGITFEEEK